MKLFNAIKTHWVLLVILVLSLFLGLYKLDEIPGEMWGDAIIHYRLAHQIQSGNLFYDYNFGDGPIYSYFVSFVSLFFGLSFYTLKLTSVCMQVLFVLLLYFVSFELFKKREIAYCSSFLAAVSFWSLTFARQPHARILVPLFISIILFLILRKKHFLAGLFMGFGLYTQASIWGFVASYFWKTKIFIISFLIAIPLILSFSNSPVNFFSSNSYFGEKLGLSSHSSPSEVIKIIASNTKANILSYNFKGDPAFRYKIPESSHLDPISGIFFLLGLIFIIDKTIKEKNKLLALYFLLPLISAQIPSVLDIHNPSAQPNMSRMIGVIPFVFMAISYGIYKIAHLVKLKNFLYFISIVLLLICIAAINIYNYFIVYPNYLPNRNTPFGKIIAEKIETYPLDTAFILIGSSWGEWGQPESESILLSLSLQRNMQNVNYDDYISCSTIKQHKTAKKLIIITDPKKESFVKTLKICFPNTKSFLLEKNGWKVAQFIETSN